MSNTVAFDRGTLTTISAANAGGALSISYDASSQSYTVSHGGQSDVFAPANIAAGGITGEMIYRLDSATTPQRLTLVTTPYTQTTASQYVGMGYLQRNTLSPTRQDTQFTPFTYGFATPPTDVPRTGSAGFAIDIFGMVSTVGEEPRVFQGGGTFNAEFATGAFLARSNSDFQQFGLISGAGVSGGGVGFTATGTLSASDALFSGGALLRGSGTQVNISVPGTINGRFYGPSANELGAAFSGTNATGTFSGAFTGRRDPSVPSGGLTLETLTGPQSFFTQIAQLTVRLFSPPDKWNISPYLGLGGAFNRQTAQAFSYSPGSSNLPNGEFGAADQIASASANFTAYRKSLGGHDVTIELYRPGSGNSELALTYLSFGRWSTTQRIGTYDELNRQHFVYGLATPAQILQARTGTARYLGIVYGAGGHDSQRALYDVTGSSLFDVDFSNQNYSGRLTLRGIGTNGAANVEFGNFDFSGTLASYLAESDTALRYNDMPSGEISTRFYGPTGEEIGGKFSVTALPGSPGEGSRIAGITVAKRQ